MFDTVGYILWVDNVHISALDYSFKRHSYIALKPHRVTKRAIIPSRLLETIKSVSLVWFAVKTPPYLCIKISVSFRRFLGWLTATTVRVSISQITCEIPGFTEWYWLSISNKYIVDLLYISDTLLTSSVTHLWRFALIEVSMRTYDERWLQPCVVEVLSSSWIGINTWPELNALTYSVSWLSLVRGAISAWFRIL